MESELPPHAILYILHINHPTFLGSVHIWYRLYVYQNSLGLIQYPDEILECLLYGFYVYMLQTV